MATTLMPLDPATSPQRATRLLPIAANLLPAEVVAERSAQRVRTQMLAVLGVVAVLIGGWYGFAYYQTSSAQDALDVATGEAAVLTQRQAEYAEVLETQNKSTAISSQLATLMADDVRWNGLLGEVRGQAGRTDVRITGMSGDLASAEGQAGAPAGGLPATATDRVVVSLIVAGAGDDKADVAAFVDALGSVKNFTNPYLTSATDVDGKVEFSVRVQVTAGALGGRYTPKKTTAPGGN